MSDFRYKVGTSVMCNLGPKGWQLGRIIALNYREKHWSPEMVAPYQVILEADHGLIYVPEDDALFCRAATPEDVRIARRMDALAPSSSHLPDLKSIEDSVTTENAPGSELSCSEERVEEPGDAYRSGRCHCCHICPRNWSYVELYSEHYRCVTRNQIKVTRHAVDLGSLAVGASIDTLVVDGLLTQAGYGQAPTLVRLPPGLTFTDEGILAGKVMFDPDRDETYSVDFVAVSTLDWDNESIGAVRLEVNFVVHGNVPPADFGLDTYRLEQSKARTEANRILNSLYDVWTKWSQRTLNNRDTCDRMIDELRRLRALLEIHPRLDDGRWWAQLGGFHMNVHKLLENALFECELYLGYALTFGNAEVRRMAEQNLEGCYQKRLLEAARFMWMDGAQHMMNGQWQTSIKILNAAAAKKDGWGWAVNYGDIWLGEASAQIVHGVETKDPDSGWLERAQRLVEKAALRADESGMFDEDGHPWIFEIRELLRAYQELEARGADVTDWLTEFKQRTVYWCAQILSGTHPFPPKPKPRLEDADWLVRRLHTLA